MIKALFAVLVLAAGAGGTGYYVAPGGDTFDVTGCEFYNLHNFESGQTGGNFLCTEIPTPTPEPTVTPTPTPTATPAPTSTPTATPNPSTGLQRYGDWGYKAVGVTVNPPVALTVRNASGTIVRSHAESASPYCAYGDPNTSPDVPCNVPTGLNPGETYTVEAVAQTSAGELTAQHNVTVVGGPAPGPTSTPAPTPTPNPGGMTSISNPNGNCINAVSGQVIENMIIGPCGEHGIEVIGKDNVTIRNVVIFQTGMLHPNPEVNNVGSFWRTAGIYVENGSNIHVSDSEITDTGRQLIIFNRVTNGSMIRINVGVADSWPTKFGWDGLSAYNSSNIEIAFSEVRGGNLAHGCAIITDGTVSGGEGHHFHDNVVENMASCGLGIAGGSNSVYERNTFGNIIGGSANGLGIYLWAYGNPVCDGNVIRDNVVLPDADGNSFWNAGDCTGSVIEGNSWQ